MSFVTGFRKRGDGLHQIACQRGVRRDHDPQPASLGVVETVDSREVRFTTAGVEAGHHEGADPLAVFRADRVHVHDARDENLAGPRDRRLVGSGRGPGELVQRGSGDPVLLADAFGGQPALANEPPIETLIGMFSPYTLNYPGCQPPL